MSNTQGSSKAIGKSQGVAKATPSLDPRTPSLIQPFKRLVEEGFITSMTVTFTPTGVQSVCQVDARVVAVDSRVAINTNYPVGMIARIADEKNLIPKKGKKSGAPADQALPKKSLVTADFSSDAALLKRAKSVAEAIGAGGLMGRIGSSKMLPEHSMRFQDWWVQADANWRLHLLTTKEKRDAILKEIDTELLDTRLRSLLCPFRDEAEIRVSIVEEDEEEEESEKESSPAVVIPI